MKASFDIDRLYNFHAKLSDSYFGLFRLISRGFIISMQSLVVATWL